MQLDPADAFGPVLDRALEVLAEPFLVRRALAELRGPGCGMDCYAARETEAGWYGLTWEFGRAVLAPGRFVFLVGPGAQTRYRLDVQAVVETRETRRRGDADRGPRTLGVRVLRSPTDKVFWSAHPRLLAEGSVLLGSGPRRPGP